MIFDRNSTDYGTALTHANNSADFEVLTAGVYYVSFNGTFGPVSGSSFPETLLLALYQNGTIVNGSEMQFVFHTNAQLANISFSQTVTVSAPTATLQMIANGGNFAYSNISLTIHRLGDIPG